MNQPQSLAIFLSALLMAATVPFLVSCQTLEQTPEARLVRHPLIGQIWDLHERRRISRDMLLQKAVEARYVLIGETHDNEDHHRIQMEILKALIAKGKEPALGMEQFDNEHQSAIQNALTAPDATSDSVANAGRFNRQGWNWSLYEPLVATALQKNRPIVAMNLSRTTARSIMNQGLNAVFGEARVAELAIEAAWNPTRDEALRRAIIEGHCGHVPGELLPKLIIAQRARDAIMADAMLKNSRTGIVAIIGREHARKDIGAPIYLEVRAPGASVISIGLVEIDEHSKIASDYFDDDKTPPYDFVLFARRIQREDPCRSFLSPTPQKRSARTVNLSTAS